VRTIKNEELKILEALDAALRQEASHAAIDPIVLCVERKLTRDTAALLAWEPVPLATYGRRLPDMIRSSWVFALRAQANTGAERHPNSQQRMMSYKGSGDLQTWDGEKWRSNYLISDADAPLESRWLSIPVNIWHQAVVPKDNWVVVSFHTVPEVELIEERPDINDAKIIHQRRYWESARESRVSKIPLNPPLRKWETGKGMDSRRRGNDPPTLKLRWASN